MKKTTPPTSCPDCAGALREILLFGRGPQNSLSGAACDSAVVHYTDGEAKRSTWLEMFEAEGTVRSMMCRACGRLFLYGVPQANTDLSEHEQKETIDCLRCGAPIEAERSSCPRCGWSYDGLPANE